MRERPICGSYQPRDWASDWPVVASPNIPLHCCGAATRLASPVFARHPPACLPCSAMQAWHPATNELRPLSLPAVTAWQTAVLDEDLMKTVCAAPYVERATSD